MGFMTEDCMFDETGGTDIPGTRFASRTADATSSTRAFAHVHAKWYRSQKVSRHALSNVNRDGLIGCASGWRSTS